MKLRNKKDSAVEPRQNKHLTMKIANKLLSVTQI